MRRALDMACGPAADQNMVFSRRAEPELVVKGGDSVNTACRKFEISADPYDRITREAPVFLLHFLQNRNERITRGIRMLFQDFFDFIFCLHGSFFRC